LKLIKKLLLVIAVLAVILLLNTLLYYLILPINIGRYKVHTVENSACDDLILGTMRACTDLDPDVLDAATGRTSFNAAYDEQYMLDCCYTLTDMVSCGNIPKRVILEFDPATWSEDNQTDNDPACGYLAMKLSVTKPEYLYDKIKYGSNQLSVIFPWRQYVGTGTDELQANLDAKTTEAYRNYDVSAYNTEEGQVYKKNGFLAVDEETGPEGDPGSFTLEDEMKDGTSYDYFHTIITLCEMEDIDLEVVTLPIPLKVYKADKESYDNAYAAMKKMSDSKGFGYQNYVTEAVVENAYLPEDYADWYGCMKRKPAEEFSGIYGAYLKERQDLKEKEKEEEAESSSADDGQDGIDIVFQW
jgi:hypothetical protein